MKGRSTMSTLSCTPVVALANSVEAHVAQNVQSFAAAEVMPERSKSMFAMAHLYFSNLAADISRSRKLAQGAYPAVRGN
jgi:hypothetical protein